MRASALVVAGGLILNLGCSGQQKAPGAPLTDISATNTENTGPFEIVERSMQDGMLRLNVRAALPAEAEAVARHVVTQTLHTAPRGVIVEVHGAGDGPPLARVESLRRPDTIVVPPTPTAAVPSPADRLGAPGQRP